MSGEEQIIQCLKKVQETLDEQREDICSVWIDDAIELIYSLLKEREPRVLTLEEARSCEVVWAEDRATKELYVCLTKGCMNDSKIYKYGVQWRVWSARPTDEQMEAVKWE